MSFFIKINNEKNPVEMYNKVYNASKNNILTPEFCTEILSHTNVPIIMTEILKKIEKKPIEEQGSIKKLYYLCLMESKQVKRLQIKL